MSSSYTIYEFELVCETHGVVNGTTHPEIEGGGLFGVAAPTVCPIDPADTVIEVRVIGKTTETQIKIKEEDIPTQGYVEIQGRSFVVPAGDTGDKTYFTIDNLMDINVYSFSVLVEANNVNDTFDMYVGQTGAVGALSEKIMIGDSIIKFTASTVDFFYKGFTVAAKNAGVGDAIPVGRVRTIDRDNNQVTLQSPSTVAIDSDSPVYAWVTRCTSVPLTIGINNFGKDKIGGSFLSEGLVTTLIYTNNDDSEKKFKFQITNSY